MPQPLPCAGACFQVGATINCGRAYDIPPTVHVQSYVSATDAEGLGVLLHTDRVFRCWGHIHETIIESELGASRSIMAAGYTIDSLMLRYQVGELGTGRALVGWVWVGELGAGQGWVKRALER